MFIMYTLVEWKQNKYFLAPELARGSCSLVGSDKGGKYISLVDDSLAQFAVLQHLYERKGLNIQ